MLTEYQKDLMAQLKKEVAAGGRLRASPILSIAIAQDEIHFVTNFSRSQREIYERAIRDSGVGHLYIQEGATDALGRAIPNCLRLMAKEANDLSSFWRKFEEIKNG